MKNKTKKPIVDFVIMHEAYTDIQKKEYEKKKSEGKAYPSITIVI